MNDPEQPFAPSRRALWDERHAAREPIESFEPDPTLVDEIGSLLAIAHRWTRRPTCSSRFSRIRMAIASSTTVSGSRRPPRVALTPTRLAVQRRARGAGLEVRFDGHSRDPVELAVEICGHVPSGAPAAEGLGEARQASLIVLGECAHEEHPPPPQSLLGRRKPRRHRPRDLDCRPSKHVVEHHGDAIDDREPCERILELVTELRSLQHAIGRHRVPVILPVRLHGIDVELIVMGPGAIDDPVDEAAPEPRAERRRVAKLVPATPGAHDGLLSAVLRLVRVPDEPGRQVHEPRELARERGGELGPGGRPVDRQFDPRGVAQRAFDFVLTRRSAYSGQKPTIPVTSAIAATIHTP